MYKLTSRPRWYTNRKGAEECKHGVSSNQQSLRSGSQLRSAIRMEFKCGINVTRGPYHY